MLIFVGKLKRTGFQPRWAQVIWQWAPPSDTAVIEFKFAVVGYYEWYTTLISGCACQWAEFFFALAWYHLHIFQSPAKVNKSVSIGTSWTPPSGLRIEVKLVVVGEKWMLTFPS